VSSPDRDANGGDGPVIRDKRRIDPATGLPRATVGKATPPQPGVAEPVSPAEATPEGPGPDDPLAAESEVDEAQAVRQQLAERTSDLQRLQAEYVNYRRRVDRDRESVRETAQVQVLLELLPVLDDIGRAREHGELGGAFASIAGALETTVTKLGLERYAAVGDPFDPTLHEALMHSYSAEVTVPTCVQVFAPGYRVGPRVVRPARVAVAEPGDAAN
jgi:molecular chaperone GrpE